MNKSRICVLIFSVLALTVIFGTITDVYANQPVRVRVVTTDIHDNTQSWYVTFQDVQPMIINDRVFVPLSGLVGLSSIYDVEWNANTSTASLFSAFTGAVLDRFDISPGSTVIRAYRTGHVDVDPNFSFNREIISNFPPQIVDGRTMVPLRLLEEIAVFDNIFWEANTRTVVIALYVY